MRVAIAGAGGMGREALAWLRDAHPDVDPVSFYTADVKERPVGADVALPVIDDLDDLRSLDITAVVLGIGDNARRRAVLEEIDAAGVGLLTVVHPTAFLGPGVSTGRGVLIAPGTIVTRDVRIGDGTVLNYGARIGHDCSIGSCVFLGPGAVLSGDVAIGDDAMIGAGAVVLPGVRIGGSARVGAGAVVTSDVTSGTTVAGVPARDAGSG